MQRKSLILIVLFIGLVALHFLIVLPALSYPQRFRVADSQEYINLADSLLTNGRYASSLQPEADFRRPPVYPLFIALIVILTGNDKWTSLLQVMLVCLNCLLIYRIGADLKARPAGIAGAIIYLLSLNAAFEALRVMTETLTAFWLILSLWALARFFVTRKHPWLFISGFAMGLAVLTRPIAFPLFIIWCVLIPILIRPADVPGTTRWKALAFFLTGGMLLILSWQVRNFVVNGHFSVSNIADVTLKHFIIGNAIAYEKHISRNEASILINSAPDPDAYILEFIQEHPDTVILMQVRGLLRWLVSTAHTTWAEQMTGMPVPSTGAIESMRLDFSRLAASRALLSPWLLLGIAALLYDFVLYGLILSSAWRMWRRHRQSVAFLIMLFALATCTYMFIAPLGQGNARFRVPVEPYLAFLAGLFFFAPASTEASEPEAALLLGAPPSIK